MLPTRPYVLLEVAGTGAGSGTADPSTAQGLARRPKSNQGLSLQPGARVRLSSIGGPTYDRHHHSFPPATGPGAWRRRPCVRAYVIPRPAIPRQEGPDREGGQGREGVPGEAPVHRRGQELGVQEGRALLRLARDQLRQVRQHHYRVSVRLWGSVSPWRGWAQ